MEGGKYNSKILHRVMLKDFFGGGEICFFRKTCVDKSLTIKNEVITLFVCIDFDGTISNTDVTDAILTHFADTEWEVIEKLWVDGKIGSRQCLDAQVKLLKAPLREILEFVDSLTIDPTFFDFVKCLRARNIGHAIVSDGFSIFIKHILTNYGLGDMQIYANGLIEHQGMLKAYFPFKESQCKSGNCKCSIADKLCEFPPIVLIGDGSSDFCLAGKADAVFAKNKLAMHCEQNNILYQQFTKFSEVSEPLMKLHSVNTRLRIGEIVV
jgi:2,3-diketo-5-methylthio-1-phosphopentane phosphatase